MLYLNQKTMFNYTISCYLGRYLHLVISPGYTSNRSSFDTYCLVEVMAFEAPRIKTKPRIFTSSDEEITRDFEWAGEISFANTATWHISPFINDDHAYLTNDTLMFRFDEEF